MQPLKNNLKLTLQILFILTVLSARLFAQGITISSGTTTLTGGSATVTLPGNWSNSGTFTAGTGTVIFNGATGTQTIANSSGETFNDLTVNKAGGDVQLSNNIAVNGILTLTSGDLDLNGKTVTLGSSATLSETSGNTVKGTTGSITTTRSIIAPSSNNIAGMGAELTSSADLGSTTITRGHTVQTDNTNSSILRYFDITPTATTGLNATLVFYYDNSEVNGLNELELELYKSTDSGNSWTLMGGQVNTTNNTVTLSGIDGFSRWTLGASSSPLPVELTTFTAEIKGTNVLLNWKTATEVDNYGFEIERSNVKREMSNEYEWEKIGFAEGHGNSNSPKDYSYLDKKPFGGSKFKYRLKQVDTDGKFEYSDEIEVEVVPTEFVLYQNYPNPFNPTTKIRYQLPRESKVILKIYDILGAEVITLLNARKEPGVYEVDFNAANLPSGIYFYKLTAGSFTDSKKMILLK